MKKAEAQDLVELYNKFSENEVEMNEDNFTIKTPETAEIIADAEKAQAPEEEVQQMQTETHLSINLRQKQTTKKQRTSPTKKTQTVKCLC